MSDDGRPGRRSAPVLLEVDPLVRPVRLETRQRHVGRRAAQLRGWGTGIAELQARLADPIDARFVAAREALEVLRLKVVDSQSRLQALESAEFEDWEASWIAVEGEWRDLAVDFKSVVGWVRALSRRS